MNSTEPIDVKYTVKNEDSGMPHPPDLKKKNPRTNIILFLITFFTTTFAGTFMADGVDPAVSIFSQGTPTSPEWNPGI